MKKTIRVMLVATILSVCMLFVCACGNLDPVTESVVGDTIPDVIPDDDVVNDVVSDAYASNSTLRDTTIPTGEYNKGVVLVKYDGALTSSLLGDLDVKSVEQLFKGSKWHTILLEDGVDTEEAVKHLHKLDVFETVDYDYVMKSDGDTVDISGNTYAEDLTYLDTMGVKNGWEHNANNKKYPGGSADVVIAIIDTGVDYNHIDLRNNIWVNSAEIPGNGIDDDGNGYVDDVNGWDCVGDDNDPMDDNGHGTHVAGIAAAENNKTGTVGVAYNCKIMCLKAGNSSGYFNNSDIAEAIQYAYMNGASVINMSFGGYSISIAVEDALMDAYNQCVLVAAAGNDCLCNNLSCPDHEPLGQVGVSYPAALPYVIGVMSCNANGTTRSAFSNFDHYPYGTVEYEVYACGEQIPSTWPNNKYATLSGTSMACPVVAGIAAVLRSTYPDREVYSNKYIQSQIVNTGTKGIMTHTVADLYEALTYIPKPNVKLYDYYIFDNVEFSDKNNGNGIIDAGETIRIGVELRNIGGVASDVNVTIDTIRNGDASITDPYFNITTSAITLSDIGTYSVRNGGYVYENGMIVGVQNYFEVVVADNCPNDYLCVFNVNYNYTNGLDDKDTTIYTNEDELYKTFAISVTNGVHLPSQFTEDTTLTADNLYILPYSTYIHEGVTVTIEPGTRIQFYTDDTDSMYYEAGIPYINVAGRLISNGSIDAPVEMFPCDSMGRYIVDIRRVDAGYVELNYTNITNAVISANKAEHCYFSQNYAGVVHYRYLSGGKVYSSYDGTCYDIDECLTSVFYKLGGARDAGFNSDLNGTFNTCIFVDSSIETSNDDRTLFVNCVFQGNRNISAGADKDNVSSIRFRSQTNFDIGDIHKNNETGTSYCIAKRSGNNNMDRVRGIAQALGGDIACIETESELDFIRSQVFCIAGSSRDYAIGLNMGSDTWINGEPVGDFIKELNIGSSDEGGWLRYNNHGVWDLASSSWYYWLIEIPNNRYDSADDMIECYKSLMKEGFNNDTFKGNAILNNLNDTNVEHWLRPVSAGSYDPDWTIGLSGNYWGTTNETLIDKMIVDFDDYQELPDIVWKNYLTTAPSNTFPFVVNINLINKDGDIVTTIGKETVRFVVEFNRDMDTTIPLTLTFGSRAPYADYKVEGEYVDARTWVGEYTLKANIENGKQYFRIKNGCAADDPFLKLYESDGGRLGFEIDTTAAMAMNLQANALDNGIQLTFAQDDYDTLLGYNIYRSEEKDGNYVKLNPAILLPTDSTFLDENAEPGKTYWYTYTVVLTDFTESNPAGKVVATAKDTMAPNMYHTPVNQGYLNNNLVISCTASDNVAITSVVLYYRAVGATEWKTITMLKQNDKYSATIFGSELTIEGLEYYIVANDTMNSISKGSAETPYTVVIKDASAISRKGDVDGDGVVTTKDALMIMQCINGDLIMSDDEFKRADLNEDGVLSSMEALRILQYINGNVTTLEM
ncbi:MAG: S8 family serine peptidase [Clostridia bacterium]|nr:S8 family serine peptidase [Clostridia bacterium]